METITKTREVNYPVYIAIDGTEFQDKNECISDDDKSFNQWQREGLSACGADNFNGNWMVCDSIWNDEDDETDDYDEDETLNY